MTIIFPDIFNQNSKYAKQLIIQELSLANIQPIPLPDVSIYYQCGYKIEETGGKFFLFTLYRFKNYYLCNADKYINGKSLTDFYLQMESDFFQVYPEFIRSEYFYNVYHHYPGAYPGKSAFHIYTQDILNKFAKYVQDNESYYRMLLL